MDYRKPRSQPSRTKGKGLRKSLWIPHIQVIHFLNFCHLAGATEPQLQGQSGTRTVSSPRQSTL